VFLVECLDWDAAPLPARASSGYETTNPPVVDFHNCLDVTNTIITPGYHKTRFPTYFIPPPAVITNPE